MKLKQTKKKLFLALSALVFCICLGFVIRKSFDNQTHAEDIRSVDDITISYDTDNATPLGTPGKDGSPIQLFDNETASRLTSWNQSGTAEFSSEYDSANEDTNFYRSWHFGIKPRENNLAVGFVLVPPGFNGEDYWLPTNESATIKETSWVYTSSDGYRIKATVLETNNTNPSKNVPFVVSTTSTFTATSAVCASTRTSRSSSRTMSPSSRSRPAARSRSSPSAPTARRSSCGS